MNATNIPTTWQEWVLLLVDIFRAALHTAVTNPWWRLALLMALVLMAAAYISPLGDDEQGPLLTEEDREAAR